MTDQLQLDWTPRPLRLPLEPERDRVRLKGSLLRVLERLREGPATNLELAHPLVGGLRAAARICELRQAGYDIHSERSLAAGREGLPASTPVWVYTLRSELGEPLS